MSWLARFRRPAPHVNPGLERLVDRQVRGHLAAIDEELSRWSTASNRPNIRTDYLLDERLMHRPPDVMASVGDWGLAA